VDQLYAACSAADAAVQQYHQEQQQKQLQAYRQLLEQVYAAAAAPSSSSSSSGSTSTTSSDTGSSSSSSCLSAQLLPLLAVSPPEGQASSFDYLTEAWSEWSDGPILDFDQVLGPGAKPSGVQRWLLPQLLDDAQPPLFVVAPPGTGRVTAVLLAAAAELAAARAEQGQEDEEQGEGEQAELESQVPGDAAEWASKHADDDGDVERPSSSGDDLQGEQAAAAAADTADAQLPWEVEGAVAAAAAAAADDDAAAGTLDSIDKHHAALDEGEDAVDEAASGVGSPLNNAPAVCSPFLLLMPPTEAAAETAARQHGPMLAAAGVTSCLLRAPPSLACSAVAAAAAPAAAAAGAAAAVASEAAAAAVPAAAAAAAAEGEDDTDDEGDEEEEWSVAAEDTTTSSTAAAAAAAPDNDAADAVKAASEAVAAAAAEVKRLTELRRKLRKKLQEAVAKDNIALEEYKAHIVASHTSPGDPPGLSEPLLPQDLLDRVEQHRMQLQKTREGKHAQVRCWARC
jgi:hypothetical protein